MNNNELFYVHLFNDFSGSPRVFRDAIDSNVLPDDNTHVITSSHPGFLDGVKANRITCFYARSNHRSIQLLYFLLSQFCLFFQLSYLLIQGRIKKQKCTVVINTMLPFGAGGAAKLFAHSVIYYVHETYIKPELLKRFLRFFIEYCSTHIIFVSRYLKEKESFETPVSEVIYNGLRSDFPIVNHIKSLEKFKSKQVFFAGSLKAYKGIDQLLKLARILTSFDFIAAINCEKKELIKYTRASELPNNLILLSRPENIETYFQNSFLVVNLSLPDGWIETFGLSLLEGMAYGTPVISPPVGGPVEFVNENNGFLIDARNIEQVAGSIIQLSSSFELWDKYSQHAFNTSKKFSSLEYQKSFKLFIEKIIKESTND